uniref:Nuclear receptor binding SET domain protein 2 n=1 Tax=Petromyzon marinus TaxID=7757 RepID=S4RGC8_PETMA
GDLVWSKVAGHPWWPCVVTSDPNVGSHTRVKEYAKSTVRHYHIVLLGGGVVQRTWVADKSTVPFEGQHQFEQLQGDAPWGGSAVNEASGPKLSKHFSAKVRAQWEEGMAEVAKAQPLSCDERHDAYSRPTDGQQKHLNSTEAATEGIVSSAAGGAAMRNGKKRQRRVRAPASVKSAAGASVPKRALRKRDRKTSAGRVAVRPEGSNAACVVTGEASSAAAVPDPAVSKKKKSNPPPQGSKRSEMALARYNYFCQKHRPQIMHDHADASEEEVELILRAQWDTLSERQKYRYRPPTARLEHLPCATDSGDSAKRQRRPTKKLLESTGDFAEESPRKKSKKDLKNEDTKTLIVAGFSHCFHLKLYSGVEKQVEVSQLADACKPLKKRNRASAPEASSCPVPLKEKAASGDTGSAQESEVSEEGQVEGPAEDEESADLSLATVSSHKRSERGGGGAAKKESVCQICEKTGELILCEGQCCSAFHLSCMELDTVPSGKFMCSECKSGVHTCFDCKEPGADLKRCLAPLCGKFYHVECVRRLSGTVLEGKGFRCSLHVCLACHISQPDNPRAFRGARLPTLR